MATINTIKIMQEKQKASNNARANTTEEMQKLAKVKKFIDTYVAPKLNVLDIANINIKDELIGQATQIAIMLDDITLENTPNPVYLSVSEVGFLHNGDNKVKSSVGSRIAEHIIRGFTYEEKKNNYIEEYITPILKNLAKQDVIIYDVEALDNKTKIATNKIKSFVDKFIYDSVKESLNFGLFKALYDEDYINKWDFIFNDDKQAKNEFANILKEYIQNNIENIDFKNINNIDFGAITGAKLE